MYKGGSPVAAMPFLVCSHELHTCKSLRCTLQPLWPGVALGPSWPVTQSSTAQQIMDIIPPAAVHTRMNSVRESCRQKKRKKIGHHARPRRASATAPLRTGADVCKTGSAAGKCAGAKSNTARRRSNHALLLSGVSCLLCSFAPTVPGVWGLRRVTCMRLEERGIVLCSGRCSVATWHDVLCLRCWLLFVLVAACCWPYS